jgi:hypothetical protein
MSPPDVSGTCVFGINTHEVGQFGTYGNLL